VCPVSGRTPFEGAPCRFEGLDVEEGREQVAQCLGMTLASPHSELAVPGMVAQRRTGRTVPWLDSRAASGDRHGEDSPFNHGARRVTGKLMLLSGEQVGQGKSQARRRFTQGYGALKRGRDPLTGCLTLERTGGRLVGDRCLY
jgi:hypothetical protein